MWGVWDVQDLTPKALPNFSPGLFQPWDQKEKANTNAESVGETARRLANAFSVTTLVVV